MSAGALSLIYFVGNVALAHSAETNFWTERRRSASRVGTSTLLASVPPAFAGISQLQSSTDSGLPPSIRQGLSAEFLGAHGELLRSLPYAQGTVRKISLPAPGTPLGPVVIHIQDVHQNLEAQRHIASAVTALANRVDVIGLEGSTRTIDLARFRFFPDKNAVALVAEESLAQNEITGPIHAALTSANPFPALIGIDDPAHYLANIEAYRRSAPRMTGEKREIEFLKTLCENDKQQIFNPALRKFDQAVNDYREGRISLCSHLRTLTAGTMGLSPEILRFAEALAIEEKLDFRAVESDRVRAVEVLAAHLDAASVAQLTAQGEAYRAGNIRYGDFYRFLKDLCAHQGIPLGKNLDTYVRYALLADSVDAGTLFDEIQTMEKAVYKRLTKTTAEAELIAGARRNYLREKLVSFSLSPEEWQEYQSAPTAELKSFESFYREAHTRDNAMAANLLFALSHIKGKSPPIGLLVTGGYHAPGLTNQLTKAGATVISFVPKIEKIDTTDGPIALGIFTQEKTPLQKLFEGENLFLGKNPLALETERLVLPAKVAVVSSGDPTFTLSALVPKVFRAKILFAIKKGKTLFLQMKSGHWSVHWNPTAPSGHRLVPRVSSEDGRPLPQGGVMHWFHDLWNRAVLDRLMMDSTQWHRWAFLTEGGFSLVGGVLRRVSLLTLSFAMRTSDRRARSLFISPRLSETIDQAVEVAEKAIVEAGDYLMEEQDRAALMAEQKPDGSWVSYADIWAQVIVRKAIKESFPDHVIVGEEDLEKSLSTGEGFTWHIDPLDGSKSYLKKNNGMEKCWGVLIGLEYKGRPIMGVCYFPRLKGPEGEPLLLMARADGPAGIRVGKKFHEPLKDKTLPRELSQLVALVPSRLGKENPGKKSADQLFGEVQDYYPSTGLGLAVIALKRVGISIEDLPANISFFSHFGRVNEWDVIGPGFILARAGGAVQENESRRSFFHPRGPKGKAGFLAATSFSVAARWRKIIRSRSGPLAPFHSLDRALAGLGWALVAANAAMLGLTLWEQGEFLWGGLMGGLAVYPVLVAWVNLHDAALAGVLAVLVRSAPPRGPPLNEEVLQKAQMDLGLHRHHIVSTMDELKNLGREVNDSLIVVSPQLMSLLAKGNNHLFTSATLGLTDYSNRTVYLSNLLFTPHTSSWLSWLQTHVRRAVVERERRRLSPSAYRRSAVGIDLALPFQILGDVVKGRLDAGQWVRIMENPLREREETIAREWPLREGGLAQLDGPLNWMRGVGRNLSKERYRNLFANRLASSNQKQKNILPSLLSYVSGFKLGSNERVVPLQILSAKDVQGTQRSLARLREVDRGTDHPVHVILAGATPEAVKQLKLIKGTPSFIVHVVGVPVATKGATEWVLDPPTLAQGIESLENFPAVGHISWLLAMSPEITVDPSKLGKLGDRDLAGSLRAALVDYIARLLKGTSRKPDDLNTLVDMVALILHNA